MTRSPVSWIDSVNSFWFDELDPKDWFSARPEIDETIRRRFANLHAALERKPPDAQRSSADEHVATVLVFDQFSRNLFRGSAASYSTDGLALSFAVHAVDHGLDAALDARRRHFLYMPFMHCESREMQERSLQLFSALGIPDALRYAVHHKSIVDRFGRFPHRNEILGRPTTEDERDFLDRGG